MKECVVESVLIRPGIYKHRLILIFEDVEGFFLPFVAQVKVFLTAKIVSVFQVDISGALRRNQTYHSTKERN